MQNDELSEQVPFWQRPEQQPEEAVQGLPAVRQVVLSGTHLPPVQLPLQQDAELVQVTLSAVQLVAVLQMPRVVSHWRLQQSVFAVQALPAPTQVVTREAHIPVDPYDPTHLVSGLHEADGVYESVDGGASWQLAAGAGFPTGGISWYPFFVDTGAAATTRKTWLAIAQDGGSAAMTSDGGGSWRVPAVVSGLQHPHGNAQIFQSGSTLYVAGLNGPEGQDVYRSADLGVTWARADSGQTPEAIVWGTSKNVYAMYAWACSGCDLGTDFEIAPQPGTAWAAATVPNELTIGPNSVVVTSDGTHDVFVALMWDQGLWRYVEP